MLGLGAWRQRFSVVAVFLGLVFSLPAFLDPQFVQRFFPSWLASQTLTLGLDLKGGVHLLLEVDEEKLLSDFYSLLLGTLRTELRASGVRYLKLKAFKDGIRFQLLEGSTFNKSQAMLDKLHPHLRLSQKDRMVHICLSLEGRKEVLENAQKKSIETIRRRVDETGTKEPMLQAQGLHRILLQMPGADDPERVKTLVGQTARLTFRIVRQILSPSEVQNFIPQPSEELLWGLASKQPTGDREHEIAYVVEREVILSGDMLVDAQPAFDEYNRVQVSFVFNRIGSDLFAATTQKKTGHLFAIVLDDKVISAPQIKEPILGGRGVIQGSFTVEEASDLALLMRSGSLPAPLIVLEERLIGPGLGADSIRLGTIVTFWAVVVVMAIMFGAYAFFGVFANLSLLLNLIFLVGAMAFLGASLTLPGIAGIALTLGMAVDANVLINERIKEELKLGRRMIPAIDFGYKRAMTTIIDSNLTTLIGAFILYAVGTGPVRGFSVTLSLGILISMLTAVGLSRVFVVYWLRFMKPERLSI